jgi:hypothetical protein
MRSRPRTRTLRTPISAQNRPSRSATRRSQACPTRRPAGPKSPIPIVSSVEVTALARIVVHELGKKSYGAVAAVDGLSLAVGRRADRLDHRAGRSP